MSKLWTSMLALMVVAACQRSSNPVTRPTVTTYSPASDMATAGMTALASAHDSTARARIAATYFVTKDELGISASTRAILTKLMETDDPMVASDFAIAAVEKYASSAIAKTCDKPLEQLKSLAAGADDESPAQVIADHCDVRTREDANVGALVTSLVVRQELRDRGETAPAAYELAEAIAGFLPL